MGKRTLKSCWKQYEKLSEQYLDMPAKREDLLAKLDDLCFKANSDQIGDALIALFVKPTTGEEATCSFTVVTEDGNLPEWQTRYDKETRSIQIHPLAIFQFIRTIQKIEVTEDMYDDFLKCRFNSFLREMSKLPSIMILFLLILQRVAYMLEIAHLEKRGGVVEIAEGEPYHTMLWAFKELEAFARRTYGINARAHFGISWYESDWITGR
jgi:hypothetical protein